MLRLQPLDAPADEGVAVPVLPPLAGGETPAQVDLFAAALRTAVEKRRATLAPALSALLERTDLAHLRMTDGHLLRSVLLAAQQQLGFPWALEIAPEDLDLLQAPPRHLRLRGAIVATALGSSAWGLWLVLLVAGTEARGGLALGAAFGLSVAYAVAAAVEAVAFRSAKRLLRVARAWILAPAFLLGGWLVIDRANPFGMLMVAALFSAPSMLTAGLVRVLARRRAVQ
jgi:hypothetical protein